MVLLKQMEIWPKHLGIDPVSKAFFHANMKCMKRTCFLCIANQQSHYAKRLALKTIVIIWLLFDIRVFVLTINVNLKLKTCDVRNKTQYVKWSVNVCLNKRKRKQKEKAKIKLMV